VCQDTQGLQLEGGYRQAGGRVLRRGCTLGRAHAQHNEAEQACHACDKGIKRSCLSILIKKLDNNYLHLSIPLHSNNYAGQNQFISATSQSSYSDILK
jgi:hypothetical protein